MTAWFRSVPWWAWLLLACLVLSAIEDIRHNACENRGGVVIKRNMIDGCREPRK